MRYRKLDDSGDFSFGHGQADFHHNTPEAVAQAVAGYAFFPANVFSTLRKARPTFRQSLASTRRKHTARRFASVSLTPKA